MMRLIPLALILFSLSINTASAGEWTIINKPGTFFTAPCGMLSNNSIAGHFIDHSGGRDAMKGFIYDGLNWTSFYHPDAQNTWVTSVNGNNITGWYEDTHGKRHGYIYDGANWTVINAPGASDTYITGISGNTVSGGSFLYNGVNWTYPKMPGKDNTIIKALDGNNFAGNYENGTNIGVFLYDGNVWHDIELPADSYGMIVTGLDNGRIAGYSPQGLDFNNGILFDGTDFTYIDYPGSLRTYLLGINGNYIFGCSTDDQVWNGFMYEIPEPATIVLCALGSLVFTKRK